MQTNINDILDFLEALNETPTDAPTTPTDAQTENQEEISSFPPTNIGTAVSDETLVVEIVVAGFKNEEVTVELVKNQLVVTGKHLTKSDVSEIVYGLNGFDMHDFKRIINISEKYSQSSKITANITNGILTILITPVVQQTQKIVIS